MCALLKIPDLSFKIWIYVHPKAIFILGTRVPSLHYSQIAQRERILHIDKDRTISVSNVMQYRGLSYKAGDTFSVKLGIDDHAVLFHLYQQLVCIPLIPVDRLRQVIHGCSTQLRPENDPKRHKALNKKFSRLNFKIWASRYIESPLRLPACHILRL
ncbi:hypothetical protein AVEN_55333-1 [Araneus ventricosus]|uniref:Uncharacterized protein n=1 Tax=Araneus ventricosus TaxID=182803 RepID=A0A4Y2DE78_ARAVE|nr:hypothetical protein AVEN_55333-1 [Araneus ventricosus]